MEDRFYISFSEGGVGLLETILTGGVALIVEGALDAITGDSNHGWYCTIEDKITGVKTEEWGASKEKAKEKALESIWIEIKDFERQKEREAR